MFVEDVSRVVICVFCIGWMIIHPGSQDRILYQAGGLFGVLGYKIRSAEYVCVGGMILGAQVRGPS